MKRFFLWSGAALLLVLGLHLGLSGSAGGKDSPGVQEARGHGGRGIFRPFQRLRDRRMGGGCAGSYGAGGCSGGPMMRGCGG